MNEDIKKLYAESNDWLNKAKSALAQEGTLSPEAKEDINTWTAKAKELQARATQLQETLNSQLKVQSLLNEGIGSRVDASSSPGDVDEKYSQFSDFLVDVSSHSHGFAVSSRLEKYRSGVPSQTRDMAGNQGSLGGFLVPDEFKAEILSARAEASIARTRANVVPMASRVLQYPALDHSQGASGTSAFFGAVQVYWTEENAAITESQPSFKQIDLQARELAGYVEVPNGLLRDSPISLNSFLSGPGSFGGAIGWSEDYAFIQGDGVGKPLGVLNSPAKISVTRNTATDFKFVDAVTMKSKLLLASTPVWIMNQSVMPKLYQFQGGNSENIFVVNAPDGTPETLLGAPIHWTEKLPALGTAGDVMLVDFSMYLIGDRQEITMDVSREHQFQKNQTAFRITQAVDGQPWLASAITLADGATQVSPFVALS